MIDTQACTAHSGAHMEAEIASQPDMWEQAAGGRGREIILGRATAWSAAASLVPPASEIHDNHHAYERLLVADTL